MRLLFVLVSMMVGTFISHDDPPYDPYSSPDFSAPHTQKDEDTYPYITIEDVRDMARQMEEGLANLNERLSDSATLAAAIDDGSLLFTDFRVPELKFIETAQVERIATYKTQVKSIEHKVDELKGSAEKQTSKEKDAQADLDRNTISRSSILDPSFVINDLATRIESNKTKFLQFLDKQVNDLAQQDLQISSTTEDLETVVKNRTCQVGSGSIYPKEKTVVNFKKIFNAVPTVSLYVTGFQSHVYPGIYNSGGDLSLIKKVEPDSITALGFEVEAIVADDSEIVLETVHCSYMACVLDE